MSDMELETSTEQGREYFIGENGLMLDGGCMAVKGSVEIKEVPINKIKLSRNSRLNVTDEEISGLMESIKEIGLLQPIGLVRVGKGYEVSYGNRRFLAVSKLGKSKIPAIVHSNKTALENDVQNLAENVQRRNLSLIEIGRYIRLLSSGGLSQAEIAIRLGVKSHYIKVCSSAFANVPTEFQKDIEANMTLNKARTPGKISLASAQAIVSAGSTYDLSMDQRKQLFQLAKSADKFNSADVPRYAAALKDGKKDPLKSVIYKKHVFLNFDLTEGEWNRLHDKYVVRGAFKTLTQVFRAMLKGEISERVRM